MQLKNLKVKTSLLIGCSVILFFVIILGAIAFIQTEEIWQDTDFLYKHPFAVNIAIREIETNIIAIHRSTKDVVLSKTEEDILENINVVNIHKAECYRLLEKINELYSGKKEDIKNIADAFREWTLFYEETIRLRQRDNTLELLSRTTGKGDKLVEAILNKTTVIKKFSLQRAQNFHKDAFNSKNKMHFQLAITIIAILILLIILLNISIRIINTPLKDLTIAVNKYRQGEYRARSNIISTNEFGELAAAYNNMAETIESEMILKNNISAISNVMFGKEKLDTFANDLLGALMSITNSNICALYFLNEETSNFEHYYSVGLSKDKIKSFSANMNEGEFGLALLEKKIKRITQIPDSTIFTFSAVTGNFKPKDIITIPILHQNKVIAIISLAGIQEYSDKTLQTLDISKKDLTTGINSILAFEKIRKYSEQLDEQNKELEMQSKELRMQTDEMQEQNAELEMQKRQISEANKLKSEFLSSMSHELRTPLNSVIALSGVLNKKLQNQIPEKEYSYLEIIERNGKHLLSLINDILDLSRIEAGKENVQYSKVSLQNIVDANIDNLQTKALEKGISLRSNIGSEIPIIVSDNSKLYHIFQNLISNAVKFTDKGSVEVSAKLVNNEVCIFVTDTGIGIAADQLPYIFDEFRQVDGSDSRKHEGAGLGLAITDKYCRMLNIKIEVESKFGQGSTFKLIISVEPKEKQLTETPQPVNYSYNHANQTSFINASEKTLLIIEDNEAQIIQLSEFLKEQKYNVNIARNGIEALEAVKIKIPDAIILDLMMPGMDGFEVLEKVRGNNETVKIPVLILTAKYLTKDELKRLTTNNIYQLIQKGSISKNQLLESVSGMFVSMNSKNSIPEKVKKKAVSKKGKAVILLVEDNADNVKTVEVLLDNRHNLIIAKNGNDGVEKAKTNNPDIILLDISLPGMDGYKVFDEIRKDKNIQNVPVIALTARAMKGDREHLLAYGFDDYISKTVDIAYFEEVLRKWVDM